MKLTRVFYIGILLLIALTAYLLIVSHVTATPDAYGGTPYPTQWDKAMIEIRWPQAPAADDYTCWFYVTDQSGSWFVGEADAWLDYNGAIYTRYYFDFGGSKWFVKDIYCVASRGGELMTSPVNQSTYYLDAMNKTILTLLTVTQ